jgi:hypothetical protein
MPPSRNIHHDLRGTVSHLPEGSWPPHTDEPRWPYCGQTLSYDPKTGSAIFYIAEKSTNAVRCKGANVINDPTEGAFDATIAFSVGQEPALHFDFVFTSFTAVDASVGGSVISDTVYTQGK